MNIHERVKQLNAHLAVISFSFAEATELVAGELGLLTKYSL